jgi:hypothetical protein
MEMKVEVGVEVKKVVVVRVVGLIVVVFAVVVLLTVKHISTAVWASPGFLQWREVALQLPKCTQPVHCPAPATGAAVRAGHLLRWVAPLCVFRRGNSGFGGWGTIQYHL